MDVWMSVRTYGLMDCGLDAWFGECVCWLLVSILDLLGLWCGVKPVSL